MEKKNIKESETNWESIGETCALTRVKEVVSAKVLHKHREPNQELCDSLEGGMGAWEVQEEGDVCILTADSHCGMAEANTIL